MDTIAPLDQEECTRNRETLGDAMGRARMPAEVAGAYIFVHDRRDHSCDGCFRCAGL